MNNTNNNNNNNMNIKPPYSKNENINSNRSDKQPINLDNVSNITLSYILPLIDCFRKRFKNNNNDKKHSN